MSPFSGDSSLLEGATGQHYPTQNVPGFSKGFNSFSPSGAFAAHEKRSTPGRATEGSARHTHTLGIFGLDVF